jgi:hypothetical protein
MDHVVDAPAVDGRAIRRPPLSASEQGRLWAEKYHSESARHMERLDRLVLEARDHREAQKALGRRSIAQIRV